METKIPSKARAGKPITPVRFSPLFFSMLSNSLSFCLLTNSVFGLNASNHIVTNSSLFLFNCDWLLYSYPFLSWRDEKDVFIARIWDGQRATKRRVSPELNKKRNFKSQEKNNKTIQKNAHHLLHVHGFRVAPFTGWSRVWSYVCPWLHQITVNVLC